MEWDGEVETLWKERHRVKVITPKGRRPIPQMYTPAKTQKWEEHIAEHTLLQVRGAEVEGDEDFTIPIKNSRIIMHVRFNLRKPKSYPKSRIHATSKPDLDNYVKAVLDGIVNAKLIEDDHFITDLTSIKRYASEEHPVGVEVDLTCIAL
jgi:Holliday junction resolvase RusA-like endonuclease